MIANIDGFPVVGNVVRAAGNLVLQDDQDCGCFRVSCRDGWCIDQPNERGQDGLHELVIDYSRGGKGAALSEARRQFREYLPRIEPCEASNCDWCGGAK